MNVLKKKKNFSALESFALSEKFKREGYFQNTILPEILQTSRHV